MVSVEPVELSAGFFRHPRGAARTSATAAAAASDARTLLCIVPPSGNDQRATRAPKAARSAVLARVLKARSAEVSMYAVIGRFTPQAFALLRIVSGLLFMVHGTSKLLAFPA